MMEHLSRVLLRPVRCRITAVTPCNNGLHSNPEVVSRTLDPHQRASGGRDPDPRQETGGEQELIKHTAGRLSEGERLLLAGRRKNNNSRTGSGGQTSPSQQSIIHLAGLQSVNQSSQSKTSP